MAQTNYKQNLTRNPHNLQTPRMLWEDRPENVKRAIQDRFEERAYYHEWGLYNSCEYYNMCNVNERNLITKIVEDNPKQTEFTFIDIGAGDFAWIRALSAFLREHKNFATKKFNIYGLSAERTYKTGNFYTPKAKRSYITDGIEEIDNVKLHYYCSFKSEDLVWAFNERGVDLGRKVDFIISRWSLRHMIDPVGTVQQAFYLLKTNGFLVVDYFPFYLEGNSTYGDYYQENQYLLFSYFDANVLMSSGGSAGPVQQFIMQKTGEGLELPISYTSIKWGSEEGYDFAIIGFTFTEEEKKLEFPKSCIPPNGHTIGSEELYNWLSDNNLFFENKYAVTTGYEYCEEMQSLNAYCQAPVKQSLEFLL